MTLNEKIILQRELHGMSQKQMAEAIGVDIEILKQWENGEQNPDREAIAKMSAVFGVTADDLLFENCPDAEMLQDGLTQAQRKFVKIASVLNWILYGCLLYTSTALHKPPIPRTSSTAHSSDGNCTTRKTA